VVALPSTAFFLVRGRRFLRLNRPWIANAALPVYLAILAAYGVKEWLLWRASGRFNVPRNLLLAGTALSWWTGIIVLDSDLAFTATNVLAHGIPYMALIWLYGRNSAAGTARGRCWDDSVRRFYSLAFVPLSSRCRSCSLMSRRLVGRPGVDRASDVVPPVRQPAGDRRQRYPGLAGAVAGVAAITHYVLDAFIWRLRQPEAG